MYQLMIATKGVQPYKQRGSTGITIFGKNLSHGPGSVNAII